MRLLAHALQRQDNAAIRWVERTDSKQTTKRIPPLAAGDAAIGQPGENADDSVLVNQVERGTRRDFAHPRADRRKVAAERIEIEERHQSLRHAKVMQGVW